MNKILNSIVFLMAIVVKMMESSGENTAKFPIKNQLLGLCDIDDTNIAWCEWKRFMKESYDHQKQRKTKRRACWPGLGRPCEDLRNRNVRDIEMKKQDDDYPVTGKGESWKTDVDKSHQQKPPFNTLDWKKANTKLHSKDIIGSENRDLIKGTTKCPPGMLNCKRSKNRRLKDMAEIKRAMKCRPGMVNCRRRKNGKRGLKGITKQKHCPQGWIFCVYGNNI